MTFRHLGTFSVAAALVLTLALPGPALAKKKKAKQGGEPPAEESLPAAADLFVKHIEAMGGEDAIRANASAHTKGTLTIPLQGLMASIEIWAQAPDLATMTMEVPGLGSFQSGFDGTIAWGTDPMSGAVLKEGAELAQTRRDSDYYSDLNYASRYPTMETLGRVQWGPFRAYKVHVVAQDGQEESVYFDQETGLKVGGERLNETEMGPMPVRMVLEDFREFAGLKIPTRITESTGPMEGIIIVNEVVLDSPDFAMPPLPADIQALLDEQSGSGTVVVPEEGAEPPVPTTDQPE